jgi:CheY-like chemotaxis protein
MEPILNVLVVDARPSDYAELAEYARRGGMGLSCLTSGAAALHAAKRMRPNLRIVNVRLPDMTGFDLVEKIGPRLQGADLFLVGDAYREEDELRAISLGATIFLCKPVKTEWLSNWRPRPVMATAAPDVPRTIGRVLPDAASLNPDDFLQLLPIRKDLEHGFYPVVEIAEAEIQGAATTSR